MRRFRIRRRRALALSLLPLAAFAFGPATHAAAPERQAAMDSGKNTVRFGDRVKLRGHFPGAPNAPVVIEQRAAANKTFKRVAQTRTGAGANYRVRVKPRRTGMWRARLASAERSPEGGLPEDVTPVDSSTNGKRIRVRSVTKARVSNRHTVSGRKVTIRGRVKPRGSQRKVAVAVGGKTITTRAGRNGRFAARWRAGSTGSYPVRVRARGNRDATGSKDRAGKVTVYRYAHASWYGPGFYGNRTACGQTLTTSTMGVAHKTMPCGTKLRLRHGGRTVSVRVIDRGPYVAGREFDLTSATRNKLGFGSTGQILSSK